MEFFRAFLIFCYCCAVRNLSQISVQSSPVLENEDLWMYSAQSENLYTVGRGITAGWDPCEESWKGVDVLMAHTQVTTIEKSSCKGISCNGSSIIFMQINGLELSGSLREQLFNVVHVKQLNASPNHIYAEIPVSLPPNLTYMDKLFNDFSGSLRDHLFNVVHVKQRDISVNTFTGDLSTSFELFEHQQQPDEQPHQPDEQHPDEQQQQPDEQPHQPDEQQQQPDENEDEQPHQPDEQQEQPDENEDEQHPDEQQEQPDENEGDQGANDNEVAAVNERVNSWYQKPDREFRRDGRKETKDARRQHHFQKHSHHKKGK